VERRKKRVKRLIAMSNLIRRLMQFIVPICLPFLLAASVVATRPSSQGGPAGNRSGSPSALQTGSDTYDQWQGEYKGSCDLKFEGKLHENATFVLRINKSMGDGTLGAIGGFDTDIRGGVTGVYFEIHLPNDSKKPDNLRISNSELSIENTRNYPYKVEIQKTTSQEGKTILSGSLTGYELRPDKGPSQTVVMDVRKFRATR
jgi:hypothetical protein